MVTDNEDLLPLCFEKSDSGYTGLADIAIAKGLIEAFVEYNPRQYIILDGLDECEELEVKQITEFFRGQVAKCDAESDRGQLRVLFVSRHSDDLVKHMPEGNACIKLRAIDNAEDIKNYVRKRISGSAEQFNLSKSDEAQIENTICRRSEGS